MNFSPAASSAPRALERADWRLVGASALWADAVQGLPRSADELYVAILGTAPQVSLRARVPTFTLPCRGLARGAEGGLALEVAVLASDYSGRVSLTSEPDGHARLLDCIRHSVAHFETLEAPSRWRSLSLACHGLGLDAGAARRGFSGLTGIPEAGPDVTAQTWHSTARSGFAAPGPGHLHREVAVELTLDPALDRGAIELTVSVTAEMPDGAGGIFGWPDLLASAAAALSDANARVPGLAG